MSLMIKGINLPNKGDILTLDIYSDGHGYASHEGEADTMDVHAIQIPEDHGNIVDESKAIVTETIDGYYEITAPTILEAEEEE